MATSTAVETVPAGKKKVVLNTFDGPTYRLVSTSPPKNCTLDDVPIIDLSGLTGDFDARKAIAQEILGAAKNSGFFYIKNHGIPEQVIEAAHQKGIEFFKLPEKEKRKLTSNTSAYGYTGFRERQANPGETKDRKEAFLCHYEPEFDPIHEGRLDQVPANVRAHLPREDFVWTDDGDSAVLPDFKATVLAHWRECLALSRRLIRVIALALELPENYFDSLTTYPGGDFAINFYPGHGDEPVQDPDEVGVGAHTDLQILTLLWQDSHRGLQVLNSAGEWMWAPPIRGTFVVNIGDFFMRMTNDRLKSTVHRVVQHGKEDRISMPFFFGFNFDRELGVLPTCIDENSPAKYGPVTCGELIAKRLALAKVEIPQSSKESVVVD